MKLVTFKHEDGLKWGFADSEGKSIRVVKTVEGKNIGSVVDFIKYCADRRDFAEIAKEAFNAGAEVVPLDEAALAAPIPVPVRNIICVGKNYMDHILEFDKKPGIYAGIPEYPCFFTKSSNTVNGPYADIPAHEGVTSAIDYEAELGVIISKYGINIPVEKAMDYVFGYTIVNDVTARDLQKNHLQWFKGKSLDGFCPMGPWIVTKDEIENPGALKVRSMVNGEIRQNSNTSDMIFNISVLISVLSAGHTLEPGDVIATGTPSGVGIGFDPPKLLRKGDSVEVEIEGIGHIRNTIV